jgi:pimeloyl-ACP methyl ester carboxylesterase
MTHTESIYKSDAGRRAVELAHWPVPSVQRHIETREGPTFVVSSGPEPAPAVVLLHGSAFNSLTWFGDVAAWSQHLRVHAVDVIGHPGLSAPVRPPYASLRYASWLDDVLAGLGVERAAFVGISLGGWLAIDYASRCPDRATALVLLAPGGIGRELISTTKLLFVILPMLMLGERGRRAALRRILGSSPAAADHPGARVVADFLSLIGKHFRQNLAKVRRFDDAELKRLTMAVLLIAGDADPMLDSHDTAHRIGRLPSTEVILLANVGHAVVGQTASILAFLRRTLVV